APAPAPASPGAPGEAGPRPPAPRASAAALPAIAPPPRPAPPAARPVSADPGRQESGPTPPLVSLPTPDPRISDKGLCGDWRLTGTVVPEVEGPGQCGIARPVRVTAVLGVPLEPAATLNCRAARTLASWMERGPVRFAPRALGARLASLRIAGSYACRSRNSVKGARLSEHSKGAAIDIRAFRLADGREISPLRGWRKGQAGAFLLQAWRAACGPFGTVLGPDSDEYHRDHLHLDVADHSNGPYCK
ncbi:MAG: extensin family protein, partial [Pseudomonadota bacterium]|nr:extensin family protein [Pseudomonadota bacterium]